MATEFEQELTELLNKHSVDAASGTPDFILAAFLSNCLYAYWRAVCWGGMSPSPEDVPEAFRKDGPPLENFKQ